MATKKTTYGTDSTEPKQKIINEERSTMPLLRRNFIIMACAIFLIVLGFVLMLGGGSTMEEFNPEIFSTRRIVIGPLLSFLGYVGVAIAIIVKPKD